MGILTLWLGGISATAAPPPKATAQPAVKEDLNLDPTLTPNEFRHRLNRLRELGRAKREQRLPPAPVPVAVLMGLDVAKSLTVTRLWTAGTTKEVQVAPGQAILAGDRFRTTSDGTARLGFGNGSQVLIAEGVQIHFPSADRAEEETLAQSPVMEQENGEVRGLAKGDGGQKVERLRIVTPTGAVAVTGTDFVVLAKPDNMTVSVFSGEVRVARSQEDLDEHDFDSVPKGQFLAVDRNSKKGGKVTKFDVGAFAKSFFERHAGMRRLWKEADQDASSDTVTARFAKAASDAKKEPAVDIWRHPPAPAGKR